MQYDGSSAHSEPFLLIAYIVIIIIFDYFVNENALFSKIFTEFMKFCHEVEKLGLNESTGTNS